MLKKILLLSTIPFISAFADNVLDPGGKTLDFAKFPHYVEEPLKAGKNLIQNGSFDSDEACEIKDISKGEKSAFAIGNFWQHANQIWSTDAALRKKIFPELTLRIEKDAANNRFLVLENKTSVARFLDKSGKPMFCSRVAQRIQIKEKNTPVLYHFSAKVKGYWAEVKNAKSLIFICRFYDGTDKKAKSTGTRLLHRLTVNPDKWQTFNCQFPVPAGTKSCSLSLAFYGAGKLCIDDVSFKEVTDKDASVKLFPMYRFDNTAWLGAGQINAVKLGIKNQRWKKTDKLKLHLFLPNGCEAVGCSGNGRLISAEKQKNNMTEYIFDLRYFPVSSSNYFNSSPNVLIRASEKCINKDLSANCFLSNGKDRGSVTNFKLKVVPSFIGRTPQKFLSGMSDQSYELVFRQPEARLFSQFYRNAGMNIVQGTGDTSVLRDELHKQTKMPRAAIRYWLGNGYKIGWRGNVFAPEAVAFKGIDGKSLKGYVCPAAVYKEDKVVMAHLLPQIEKFLRHHEFIMPNWEPFVVNGLGCFCNRCLEDFIVYMRENSQKPTEKEIRAAWPRRVMARYKEQWIKFRSKQHGALMGTLEKQFVSIGRKLGKKAHFMPEFELFYVTKHGNYAAAQYNPLDFIGKLEWIALWGPYLYTHPNQVYQYYPGMNIVYLYGCEGVWDFLAENNHKGKIANFLAMPGGGYDGAVAEPEALAMDTVSAFVAGYKGSIPWAFPFGCDYRWWKALAKANDLIARNEDVILDGKKVDSVAEIFSRTALPRTFIPVKWREVNVNFRKEYPQTVGKSILQCRAFRKDGITVAAVGNFWSRGECFFELKINDLPSGKYAVTDQDDLDYGRFSASELKKGILLHAGALRWKFFRIEKNGSGGKVAVSQQKIKMLMQKKQKQLAQLAAEDNSHSDKMEKLYGGTGEKNDLSAVRTLKNGNIVLQREKEALRIKTSAYSVLLSPDDRGVIKQCVSGKNILIEQGRGHACEDGFWGPAQATIRVSGGYKFKSCGISGKTIVVQLEKEIKDNKALTGLLLQKKYSFAEKSFTVETNVINRSKDTKIFRFRYHNAPSLLMKENGIYQIGKMRFQRTFNVNLYRFSAPDRDVERLIGAGKIHDIAPGSLRISADKSASFWQMDFEQKRMQAAVFWDSINGSSAEIIFKKSILHPGENVRFSARLYPAVQ